MARYDICGGLLYTNKVLCDAYLKKKKEMGGILLRHLWEQDMHGRNFSQLTDGAHYCEAEPA